MQFSTLALAAMIAGNALAAPTSIEARAKSVQARQVDATVGTAPSNDNTLTIALPVDPSVITAPSDGEAVGTLPARSPQELAPVPAIEWNAPGMDDVVSGDTAWIDNQVDKRVPLDDIPYRSSINTDPNATGPCSFCKRDPQESAPVPAIEWNAPSMTDVVSGDTAWIDNQVDKRTPQELAPVPNIEYNPPSMTDVVSGDTAWIDNQVDKRTPQELAPVPAIEWNAPSMTDVVSGDTAWIDNQVDKRTPQELAPVPNIEYNPPSMTDVVSGDTAWIDNQVDKRVPLDDIPYRSSINTDPNATGPCSFC